MTDTLFKEVHYSLGVLINDIGLGRIGVGSHVIMSPEVDVHRV